MRKRKGKKLIESKTTVIDGITFDSATEAKYYSYIKENQKELGVTEIIIQPKFELIPSFEVTCSKCVSGKVPSLKTNRMINCKACKGSGKRIRQGMTYTPDFILKYDTGQSETIDVKGGRFTNESFPLRKKMWEYIHKQELIVVYWDDKKKRWVKK